MQLYVGCLLFVAKWLYKAFDCGVHQKYQVGVPPVALQVKYFFTSLPSGRSAIGVERARR